jgi:hypothetical protein
MSAALGRWFLPAAQFVLTNDFAVPFVAPMTSGASASGDAFVAAIRISCGNSDEQQAKKESEPKSCQ